MSYQFYNNWPYNYSVFPSMIDHIDPVNNIYFTGLHTEIENIEDELGLNPSDTFDTVRNRLAYIQPLAESGDSGVTDIENNIKDQVKWISISYAAFQAAQSEAASIDVAFGYLKRYTGTGHIYCFAGINLPQGATVTKVSFGYYKTAAGDSVTFRLYRRDRSTGAIDQMWTGSGLTSGSYAEIESESITYPVVDNENYAYLLYADLNATTDPDDARLYLARIRQTVPWPS